MTAPLVDVGPHVCRPVRIDETDFYPLGVEVSRAYVVCDRCWREMPDVDPTLTTTPALESERVDR